MNDSEIKVTYNGVIITYDDLANCWRYILRGFNRHAESLAKAKEAIDRPVKKASTFKPFDAFYWPGFSGPRLVRVTSIAEGGFAHVWIVFKDEERRNRSKARVDCIVPCDAASNAAAQDWRSLYEEIKKLQLKQGKIRESLKTYQPPVEEE